MNNIPPLLKKRIASDSAYKTCMLHGHHKHECEGRITLEHAVTYAGKQVQAHWAIISLCAKGHEVDQFQDAHTMKKEMNEWVAYNRATAADFLGVYKSNPEQRKRYLNSKYGEWHQNFPLDKAIAHLETSFPVTTHERTIFMPASFDRKNIDTVRRHCLEAEGSRYTDAKIISMALEAYAKELEAIKELVK